MSYGHVTMAVLSVLSHIAAATLLVSGVAKLRAPDSTRPLLEIAAERIAAEAPSLRPLSLANQLVSDFSPHFFRIVSVICYLFNSPHKRMAEFQGRQTGALK